MVSVAQSLGFAATAPTGMGDPARDSVMTLGLCIDSGGTDAYGPPGVAPMGASDSAVWTGSADVGLSAEQGVGIDDIGATGL